MRRLIFFQIALLVVLTGVASEETNATQHEGGHTVWTEYFSNDDNLKTYLRGEFLAEEGADWETVIQFKKRFSISDERLRKTVLSLYEESLASKQNTASHQDALQGDLLRQNALFWLASCADAHVKEFLLDYAASQGNDSVARGIAVSSYLRVADANEARDALVRFLVGRDRMDDMTRLSLYQYAQMTWHETDSVEKEAAILAALMVAAAHGEGKIGFVEVDRIIAMRSDAYRRSRERLALLEHHSLEPPTANLYTDADLGMALAEARKFRVHTSVNTNADLLKARDFSQAVVWRMSRRGAACSLFPARRPCLRRGAFLRRAQAHHGSAPAGAGRPVSAQLVQVSFPA